MRLQRNDPEPTPFERTATGFSVDDVNYEDRHMCCAPPQASGRLCEWMIPQTKRKNIRRLNDIDGRTELGMLPVRLPYQTPAWWWKLCMTDNKTLRQLCEY